MSGTRYSRPRGAPGHQRRPVRFVLLNKESTILRHKFCRIGKQDVLGLVLLVQACVHNGVTGVIAGGRVHDLLLGALVHRKQSDEVLEGVALLVAGAGLGPGKQGLDLVVLAEEQVDDVLVLRGCR
jgi:hypothetical protein